MKNRFPRGSVTISDVAAAAGVSKATVSKWLGGNKSYYIAEETRERIAAAIKQLEFQPNAMARGLSLRRSNTVGVVVASIANPFYPPLIAGIEEGLHASEYVILLGSTDRRQEKEADIVRSMMQRQVDGLILASVTMQDSAVVRLLESDVDVVLASRGLEQRIVDTVSIDNRLGGRLAVAHLLKHGHRRIAHLTGPLDILPFRGRFEGYRDALAGAGIEFDDALVRTADNEAKTVRAAMTALLDLSDPPTAVFVANDRMALEVMEFYAQRRLRIPADLAIIGFDNVWVGELSGVGLTTVDSKGRSVGRIAAELLMRRMLARRTPESTPANAPEIVALEPELIIRRSCGC